MLTAIWLSTLGIAITMGILNALWASLEGKALDRAFKATLLQWGALGLNGFIMTIFILNKGL